MNFTLRELWHASPFEPFEIQLADGRSVRVPHPDHFAMSPKGTDVIVWDDRSRPTFINSRVIVSITKAGQAVSLPT